RADLDSAERRTAKLAAELAAGQRDRDAAQDRAAQLSAQVTHLAAALAGLGEARTKAAAATA
ncbi:MAG TPA: serine/threonine protein kinase, partial [Pilimelia sp.]|nr:serine/threonine protein kinase [Pilimelia sp.]